MKSLILGINLTGGVGKESGKPFAFAPKAYITAPLELIEGEKYWRKGAGHEPMEVECTDEAYNSLLRQKSRMPGMFEIEQTFRNQRIGGQNVTIMVINSVKEETKVAA